MRPARPQAGDRFGHGQRRPHQFSHGGGLGERPRVIPTRNNGPIRWSKPPSTRVEKTMSRALWWPLIRNRRRLRVPFDCSLPLPFGLYFATYACSAPNNHTAMAQAAPSVGEVGGLKFMRTPPFPPPVSRGDVQPYIALGLGLQAAGHRVHRQPRRLRRPAPVRATEA